MLTAQKAGAVVCGAGRLCGWRYGEGRVCSSCRARNAMCRWRRLRRCISGISSEPPGRRANMH